MADIDFDVSTNDGDFTCTPGWGTMNLENGSVITWGGTGDMITRTRYMELMKIAKELCDWLEKKGVKPDEGCKVRKLTEQLWEMKK